MLSETNLVALIEEVTSTKLTDAQRKKAVKIQAHVSHEPIKIKTNIPMHRAIGPGFPGGHCDEPSPEITFQRPDMGCGTSGNTYGHPINRIVQELIDCNGGSVRVVFHEAGL